MKAIHIALFLALGISQASGQVAAPRIHFTNYDKSLGSSGINADGDIVFSGVVTVSGKLRLEREDPDLCGGVCAYFVPDATSQKRLPRNIGTNGPMNISIVNLYDASPILNKLVGRKSVLKILSKPSPVFEYPVTVVLKDYRIYGACNAIHHQAKVLNITRQGEYVALSTSGSHGGC